MNSRETEWRSAQSGHHGAPPALQKPEQFSKTARLNSLFIREFTGNFAILNVRRRNALAYYDAKSNGCREIPCANEQGIILAEQGMAPAYQGNHAPKTVRRDAVAILKTLPATPDRIMGNWLPA